jgi:hypothetical protein
MKISLTVFELWTHKEKLLLFDYLEVYENEWKRLVTDCVFNFYLQVLLKYLFAPMSLET